MCKDLTHHFRLASVVGTSLKESNCCELKINPVGNCYKCVSAAYMNSLRPGWVLGARHRERWKLDGVWDLALRCCPLRPAPSSRAEHWT